MDILEMSDSVTDKKIPDIYDINGEMILISI